MHIDAYYEALCRWLCGYQPPTSYCVGIAIEGVLFLAICFLLMHVHCVYYVFMPNNYSVLFLLLLNRRGMALPC